MNYKEWVARHPPQKTHEPKQPCSLAENDAKIIVAMMASRPSSVFNSTKPSSQTPPVAIGLLPSPRTHQRPPDLFLNSRALISRKPSSNSRRQSTTYVAKLIPASHSAKPSSSAPVAA